MPEIEVLDPVKGKSIPEVAGYLRAESKKLKEEYEKKIVQSDSGPTYNVTVAEAEAYRDRQNALGEIGKYLNTLREAEQKNQEINAQIAALENTPARPMQFSNANNGEQQPQFK